MTVKLDISGFHATLGRHAQNGTVDYSKTFWTFWTYVTISFRPKAKEERIWVDSPILTCTRIDRPTELHHTQCRLGGGCDATWNKEPFIPLPPIVCQPPLWGYSALHQKIIACVRPTWLWMGVRIQPKSSKPDPPTHPFPCQKNHPCSALLLPSSTHTHTPAALGQRKLTWF